MGLRGGGRGWGLRGEMPAARAQGSGVKEGTARVDSTSGQRVDGCQRGGGRGEGESGGERGGGVGEAGEGRTSGPRGPARAFERCSTVFSKAWGLSTDPRHEGGGGFPAQQKSGHPSRGTRA